MAAILAIPVIFLALIFGFVIGGGGSGNCLGSAGSGGTVSCPDGTISAFAKNASMLSLLNQNLAVYKQAAQQTNVPWEVIAALHYREANLDPNSSVLSGEKIGTQNPDDHSVTTTSLLDSAIKAGQHFRGKVEIGISEGTLPKGTSLTQATTDMDVLGKGFLWYNAGNHSQHGANNLTKNHSYVMNNYSPEYQGLPFNNGGVHVAHESRDGAYTVFALLKNAQYDTSGRITAVGNCTSVGTTSTTGTSTPATDTNPSTITGTNEGE